MHAARKAEERKCKKNGTLGTRFKFESVAGDEASGYRESTMALTSEIERRITEASCKSREARAKYRLGLVTHRSNAISILKGLRKIITLSPRLVDYLHLHLPEFC